MTNLLQKCVIGVFLVFIMGHQVSSIAQEKMTDRHFTIAAGPSPPFLIVKRLPGGQEILSGQIGDAINFWHYARNFSYTLVKSKDGQYGNCVRPNNCSGIVGMVQRNEVDFAIGLRQI